MFSNINKHDLFYDEAWMKLNANAIVSETNDCISVEFNLLHQVCIQFAVEMNLKNY